ncbi:MAG: CoA-transferase [Thermodesulfobacteriota bacterium]
MKYSTDYSPIEMMIIAGAREIENGQILIVGTQWPIITTLFAKKTHAPDITICYEGGVVLESIPDRIPLFTGDPCIASNSVLLNDSLDTLGMVLHAGYPDIAFLPGANVDRYGNVNTTCFGDYSRPKFRLGGSGGACDFGSLAKRVITMLEHERQRFPERVDFITTPGYLNGLNSREEAGLRPGTGPGAVITTLGIFRFHKDTREMYVDTYYPGGSIEEVKKGFQWDIKVSENVKVANPPTEEEIRILRDEIDPFGMYLKNNKAKLILTL